MAQARSHLGNFSRSVQVGLLIFQLWGDAAWQVVEGPGFAKLRPLTPLAEAHPL